MKIVRSVSWKNHLCKQDFYDLTSGYVTLVLCIFLWNNTFIISLQLKLNYKVTHQKHFSRLFTKEQSVHCPNHFQLNVSPLFTNKWVANYVSLSQHYFKIQIRIQRVCLMCHHTVNRPAMLFSNCEHTISVEARILNTSKLFLHLRCWKWCKWKANKELDWLGWRVLCFRDRVDTSYLVLRFQVPVGSIPSVFEVSMDNFMERISC